MNLLRLLRPPTLFNNVIMNETLKKRRALTFRKTLGIYNYKVRPKGYYKNMHAMPLHVKEQLRKNGEIGRRKIFAIENLSSKPYGRFVKGSRFVFERKRLPFYNIPDLTNFKLKPYVTYNSTKIEAKDMVVKKTKLDRELFEEIRLQLENSNNEEIRKLSDEIFKTEFGNKMIDLYIKRREMKRFKF